MRLIFPLRYGHVILALFAVNALTYTAFTTVWMDEGMCTDPAANLYFGHGFVSSAWATQSIHDFWAGNAPLHEGLLSLWFQCFGFGLFQARLFNYTLWSLAVWLICASSQRLKFVTSASGLCILAALLFLGQSVAFNYHSGRYDTAMVLVTACAYYSFSLQNKKWRYGFLFISGAFFIPAGTMLAPFAGIIMVGLILITGMRYIVEFFVLGLGIVFGGAGLFFYLALHGVAEAFVHAAVFLKQFAHPVDDSKSILPGQYSTLWPSLTSDKSAILLWLLFIPVYLLGTKTLSPGLKKGAQFALVLFVALPVVFVIIYTFPMYYAWMCYIPLCIGLMATLEAHTHPLIQRYRGIIYAVIIVAASLPGLPMRLTVASLDWPERDYHGVETFVHSTVRKDDVVFADYQAFYALQEMQTPASYWWYLHIMSPEEKQALTCLVIKPGDVDFVIGKVGGEWQPTGESYLHPNQFGIAALDRLMPRYFDQQTTTKYNLIVYRRK